MQVIFLYMIHEDKYSPVRLSRDKEHLLIILIFRIQISVLLFHMRSLINNLRKGCDFLKDPFAFTKLRIRW